MSVQDQTLVDLVNEVFRLFRTLKSISHEPQAESPRLAHIGILGLLGQLGECRATELAERIGVGPSALSRQLADMDEQGLVRRRPDPDDGRASLIALSDDGSRVLGEVLAQRAGRMRERLSGWDEEEAQQALNALSRMADALRNPAGALPSVTQINRVAS
ncbi:MarR family winged helix-turn-helix transcriptional regulator [Psychromicrobium xiongbiense]|uniref:MarR family winged helix-turn-helix transcriptional regulator n=1 Tax=Psychromicrobium xiongbiense TaxID=3051184 RepID=UPI002552DF09|nr:MarR family winged helix-turn-helix transcriptional regulator [Psychromicrobium sp. YIM S02556]